MDINNELKDNPDLEKEVFEKLHELESGNKETRDKFKHLVKICIDGQTDIFQELDIEYDTFKYESYYIFKNITEAILNQLKDTGKLTKDQEGRLVLNQEEYNLPTKAPYLVLTRADRTSLYPLRDIAYTIDKIKKNSEKNIIVLGEDQKLYFKQIQAVLDLLGYKAPEPVHYSFVLLAEGKMSTRQGTVVLLEDFMKKAVEKAKEEIKKRNRLVDEKTAKSIAYGAVKYEILKVANEKNVTFDLDSALSFEGNSGPYLQYSYTRINSILNKYKQELPEEINYSLLNEDIEYELIKELSNFNNYVQNTISSLSPYHIANYLYSLARKFSLFYHECPVLNLKDVKLKEARLLLIKSVSQVLKNGLNILGIRVVKEM